MVAAGLPSGDRGPRHAMSEQTHVRSRQVHQPCVQSMLGPGLGHFHGRAKTVGRPSLKAGLPLGDHASLVF
jgi:hypothetical protein